VTENTPGNDDPSASDTLEKPLQKKGGLLDMLVDTLNENAGDGERWEHQYNTPQMECGDGRWRNLDGTFASMTPAVSNPDETHSLQMVEAMSDPDGCLTIEMPMDGFSPAKLDNLFNMINAKASLLKAALGVEELPVRKTDDTLQFPWFGDGHSADEINAYATLISKICAAAKEKSRVTARERLTSNAKYQFRCWLLALGFIGDAYKTSRKILLSRLEGNSSYAKLKEKKEPQEA
jgi:hypothetical protein